MYENLFIIGSPSIVARRSGPRAQSVDDKPSTSSLLNRGSAFRPKSHRLFMLEL